MKRAKSTESSSVPIIRRLSRVIMVFTTGKLESFYFIILQSTGEDGRQKNINGNSGIDSSWKNLNLSMVVVLSLD